MLEKFNNIYVQATLLFVLSYIGWVFEIPSIILAIFLVMTFYNVFYVKQNKILPYIFLAVIPLLDVTAFYFQGREGSIAENLHVFKVMFFIALPIMIVMGYTIVKNIKKITNKEVLFVFGIFIATMIPSMILGIVPSFFETVSLYVIPFILLLLVATVDDFTMTDISVVVVSLALQSSLDMLTVFIQGDMVYMIEKKQIDISWSISSNIGSYIVYALPFMSYLIYKYIKISYITIPLTIWLVVAMFASGSRNAMLAFGVIIIPTIILGLRHADKEYRRRLALSIVVGGLLLSVIFYFSGMFEAIFTRMFDLGLNDRGRFRLWEIGWDQFKENPLFGQGLFSLKHYTNAFSTHNVLIDTLAFTGLFGMAGLITVSLWIARQVKRNFENKTILIFLAFVAFFVTCLVDTSHYNPISLFLLVIPIPYFAKMNE